MIVTFYKFNGKVNRYYTIHDRQGDLFTTYSFTALWGAELYSGREKVYRFDSRKEMEKKIRFLFRKRVLDGYRVLYSFARKSEERALLKGVEVENRRSV